MKIKFLKLPIFLTLFCICNLAFSQTTSTIDFKLISVNGFNVGNEPTIKLFLDNHIEVDIKSETFFVDSDENHKKAFLEGFDKDFSKALQLIFTKTKEGYYIIEKSNLETAEKIKKYLETYWK